MTATTTTIRIGELAAHMTADHEIPQSVRALVEAHRAHPEVPTALLAAVGWHESHLGCARASGGCWGSPRDRDHRHTAGTPTDAARDLAHALRACGSVEGAIARFRGGSCRPGPHTAYVARVAALAARLSR